MLDKSIVFKNIIMKIEYNKIQGIIHSILPEGYSIRFFTTGDEKYWAQIEASVLEFDSTNNAKDYFEKAYLPYIDELNKRCLFVLNSDGIPIATASSWFADSELGHQAALHWVAVCPDYQGLGIGKAIVKQALVNFRSVEPNNDVWLHTQTWSHIAIKLYHSLGFNLVKNERLANTNTRTGIPKIYPNDFDEAIDTLKNVMDENTINQLISTAV